MANSGLIKRLCAVTGSLLKRILQRIVASIPTEKQFVFLRHVANSPFLTALFYYFKGTYYFEQRGVLMGKLIYNRNLRSKGGIPLFHLIRNVHFLEKVLSMRRSKSTFAESYIQETLTALEKVIRNVPAKKSGIQPKETIAWAFDVLAQYLNIAENTRRIQKAKEHYKRLSKIVQHKPGKRSPYKRGSVNLPPLKYESLKKLAFQRRSVRRYQQRSVPREDIDRAIEIAALSPSACNRQPFEFRVYDEPKLVKKICELPIGAEDFKEYIQCLIVFIGEQSAYFDERDRHLIYIDGGLAAMAFQLALETLGLSSVVIGWPSINNREKAMEKLLNLNEDERVVILIAVGYADPEGLIPYSQKKPLSILRSYNKQ